VEPGGGGEEPGGGGGVPAGGDPGGWVDCADAKLAHVKPKNKNKAIKNSKTGNIYFLFDFIFEKMVLARGRAGEKKLSNCTNNCKSQKCDYQSHY